MVVVWLGYITDEEWRFASVEREVGECRFDGDIALKTPCINLGFCLFILAEIYKFRLFYLASFWILDSADLSRDYNTFLTSSI